MSETTQQPFEQWAIVEIMGHQRYAGLVTEQVIAGTGFVRIDVPETERGPAYTKVFGPSAIYGITFCTEEIARAVAEAVYVKPVLPFELAGVRRELEPATARADLDAGEDGEDGPENEWT